MYNSQYYSCEQIDERLLQGYLDDYNSENHQSLSKHEFLTKLRNALYSNYITEAEVLVLLTSKQDVIEDLEEIREGAEAGAESLSSFTIAKQSGQTTIQLAEISHDGDHQVYLEGNDDISFTPADNNTVVVGLGNNAARSSTIGYFTCDTAAATAAKTISATGYILSIGGSIKIKMANANTVANATLNINSTGAKPLYYDGKRASADNSWEAGETVEVYYDGTNFYANNVAGGGKFSTGEKVKEVGIDNEPTSGSGNLVKSGGIYQYVERSIHDITAETHIIDTTGTFSLTPNTFYIFDNIIEDINIVLGTPVSGRLNEYNLEFTCDENSQINFPNTLRWIDDEPLEPEQGYTYQVSIVDGLAVYGAWEGGQNE